LSHSLRVIDHFRKFYLFLSDFADFRTSSNL
jgi:hypothetical protein